MIVISAYCFNLLWPNDNTSNRDSRAQINFNSNHDRKPLVPQQSHFPPFSAIKQFIVWICQWGTPGHFITSGDWGPFAARVQLSIISGWHASVGYAQSWNAWALCKIKFDCVQMVAAMICSKIRQVQEGICLSESLAMGSVMSSRSTSTFWGIHFLYLLVSIPLTHGVWNYSQKWIRSCYLSCPS